MGASPSSSYSREDKLTRIGIGLVGSLVFEGRHDAKVSCRSFWPSIGHQFMLLSISWLLILRPQVRH
jgi:hypothetical protein